MKSSEIFKKYDLRVTKCRRAIIDMLEESDCALAHSDLEEQLKEFDRVTLYRTLNTFLEIGIVHKVLDDHGVAKYALCNDSCDGAKKQHSHEHVHFKCKICDKTTCIDSVEVPEISLPEGFKVEETNILIVGVCKFCNLEKELEQG
ncbi:Fur family transcriptional regulator [Aureibacter tunicatorum]|uniref:Fur family ferric uptake transcriptional regulator n=1 Tax=Aureibacter tunicatorum TaxID=866807 RepID=A0AAE4BRN8_9BACT|nr:transcriptional repressor [Aureibacter tunicatorum]MDR6237402.1 Fur family ferric uptake transcriptional regulator [Aureibacter tunicatorum]BDD06392.1 transcriptional regulator [Aureibacter tunicatorum]